MRSELSAGLVVGNKVHLERDAGTGLLNGHEHRGKSLCAVFEKPDGSHKEG